MLNLFSTRNNEAIEQMREDVETYEEAVRKQAALAEQARLKEQAAKEQERRAKPSPSSTSRSRQRITQTKNQNRKPMASIKAKFRPSIADFLAELE